MTGIRTQCADLSAYETPMMANARRNAVKRLWHVLCLLLCMKNTIGMAKEEKGAAMMEYVIVMGLGAALAIFLNRVFFSAKDGFGPMGQGVVAFFQRLQGGLSLPVP